MIHNSYSPLSFRPDIADAVVRSDFTFIITGAGGWLGQATLEMLEQAMGDSISRRVTAFTSSARELQLRSGRMLSCRALQDIAKISPRKSLIFHYAFLTRDKIADMPLETFITQNKAISDYVFAAMQYPGAAGIFVPSSGAVYRADRTMDEDMQKNPYGVMKAQDEQRFLALSASRRVVISRVFNLSGPFINKLGSYALSSIIMDILNGRPIELHADKEVWRSYMHVRDVVELAMLMLIAETSMPCTPFDTTGEEDIEIGALAERVVRVLGKPGWSIHRPPILNSENRYIGDGNAIRGLLADFAIIPYGLDTQILDTAAYCQNLLFGWR